MLIRLFDILLSGIAICLLFPFMIPVVVILKATGEHYIFYRQTRIGRHGKPFQIVKFATMLKNSPQMPGRYITQANDPRVLPVGKILRKTKINELPQLLNVFIGQMSLVGARPLVSEHLSLYPEDGVAKITEYPPGLTGVASLVFRDEEGILDRMGGDRKHNHDNVIAPYKYQLEVWYAEHRNIGWYFLLIFLTAFAIVSPNVSLIRHFRKKLPVPSGELSQYL